MKSQINIDTSHEHSVKFAEMNPNPVLSADMDGVLLFRNPASIRLLNELQLERIENLLPADHNSLVKACLNTGATLTQMCHTGRRSIEWSYIAIEDANFAYIYGHDVSDYQVDNVAAVLPKANPNPVISYTAEGVLKFSNLAVSNLLQNMHLVNVEEILPVNHEGLLKACVATNVPLTEERNVEDKTIVWSYKSFEDSGDIYIYGHDLSTCSSKMFCTEGIPRTNPSPVLSTDSEGVPRFINHATSRILQELKLDKVEDILPECHKSLVRACLTTKTPLTEERQNHGRTIIWSYHPIDDSDFIYIYGHDVTDYHSNIFSMGIPLVLHAIFDSLATPILIVDIELRVNFANHTAKTFLSKTCGLNIKDGFISEPESVLAEDLKKIINALLDKGDTQGHSAPQLVQRGKYEALVSMLEMTSDGNVPPMYIIYLFYPGLASDAFEDILISLYGLTSDEAKLIEELICGNTLQGAVKALGVDMVTVRTWLKSIYSKTKVRSQAQLIKCIIDGPVGQVAKTSLK